MYSRLGIESTIYHKSRRKFLPFACRSISAESIGVWGAVAVFATAALWQAVCCAPTTDEPAALACGIATLRTGQPGYYRVNPPLHGILSGVLPELLYRPSLPILYRPSAMPSGHRHEFLLGEQFCEANLKNLDALFVFGRMNRIALVILGGMMLAYGLPESLRPIGTWASVLWFTSPMVLGHGWLLTPDCLSGVASILLIVTSLRWLSCPQWKSSLMIGLAWGLCVGCKFTFCPLYLLWFLPLSLHGLLIERMGWTRVFTHCVSHVWHGAIAWLVILALYNFQGIGMQLSEHDFRSLSFRAWSNSGETLVQPAMETAAPWRISRLRSPFPSQFLIGIDEQMLDLERGYPTYVLGTWYPRGIWWYYCVGILIKEQPLFLLSMVIALYFLWIRAFAFGKQCVFKRSSLESVTRVEPDSRHGSSGHASMLMLCVAATCGVFVCLSWNSKMSLNVRYLFPALPAMYLCLGWSMERLRTALAISVRTFVMIAAVFILLEQATNFPHFYSYANPCLGGSRRTPPALHDSNFDGGQDLWYLRKWLEDHTAPSDIDRYVVAHSALPRSAVDWIARPPSIEMVQFVCRAKRQPRNRSSAIPGTPTIELIVMRGSLVPAKWTRRLSDSNDEMSQALASLVTTVPDQFITPTIAIYRVRSNSDVGTWFSANSCP